MTNIEGRNEVVRKAYKYRIRPTEVQISEIERIREGCIYVWNYINEINATEYYNTGFVESKFTSFKLIPEMRRKNPKLLEILVTVLRNVIQSNILAWESFRKYQYGIQFLIADKEEELASTGRVKWRQGYLDSKGWAKERWEYEMHKLPRGKKPGDDVKMCWEKNDLKIVGDHFSLGKLDNKSLIKFVKHRDLNGEIKTTSITRETNGKYNVSFSVEEEVFIPVHKGGIIGINRGVKRFCGTSKGELIEPINSFQVREEKIKKLKEIRNKKIKGSNNYKRIQKQITKLEDKAKNCRKDFTHKLSKRFTDEYSKVIFENYVIPNMTKKIKNMTEKEIEDFKIMHISQKPKLNKAILDQGWGMFGLQLEYKAMWKGGEAIKVSPVNISQKCIECGYTDPENKNGRTFICKKCGYTFDIDIMASRKVYNRYINSDGNEGDE